jgi:hypothetical protein
MKPLAILAGASLMALAGASAVAQPAPSPTAPDQQAQARRSDADAMLDARLAGVRAGLRLTPEQDRLFAPVEQAYRAMAAERSRRMEEYRAQRDDSDDREQLNLMQRLDRRADRASQNAQRLTSFANAMRPFWNSLDDSQKRLLPRLLYAGHGSGHMGMMRRHHDRMDRDDRDDDHRDRGSRRMEREGRMDRGPHRMGGETFRL